MSEANEEAVKALTEKKFYKLCQKCGRPHKSYIPYCDRCLGKMKHKTELEKNAAKTRNSEIVSATFRFLGVVTKCPECDEKVWCGFRYCPECGKVTQEGKTVNTFKVVAVIAVVLAVMIPVGLKIAKKNAFENACEQMKISITQICESYGLEVESVYYYLAYTNEEWKSELYYFQIKAKSESKAFIGYRNIHNCLLELDDLHFDYDNFLLNGKYISPEILCIDGVTYSLDYDDTLRRGGEHVYGTAKPETTTYNSRTRTTTGNKKQEERSSRYAENRTGKNSYATTKYRTTTSQYNIKDYGHADDFYDDYWDDFDNYEDAEDYYDEYDW